MSDNSSIAFEYFEIRPCIETGDAIDAKSVESFSSFEEYETALAAIEKRGAAFQTFWTLYGRYSADGDLLAMAIGDFKRKEDAFQVMNAILAPMAAARDLIREKGETLVSNTADSEIKAYERAADDLEDVIMQSSNSERI